MSKYTTEVRFICEYEADLEESKGFNNVDAILTAAAPKIFNFNFPMWDESYRLALEKKILKHYYTREICAETVGLWKLWLDDRMNMIMPYYNQLYQSTVLQFNPLYDVDVTTERTVDNEGTTAGNTTMSEASGGTNNRARNLDVDEDTTTAHTGTTADTVNRSRNQHNEGETSEAYNERRVNDGTSSQNGNDWELYSDTPQGGITGVANASIIQDSGLTDYAYLTTAQNNKLDHDEEHEDEDNISGTRYGTNENDATDAEITTKNGTNNISETINRDTASTDQEITTVTGNKSQMGTSQLAVNNTEEYVERVVGKRGGHTYSAMIMEFRKTILNIDAMIIDELSDLFFGLWD